MKEILHFEDSRQLQSFLGTGDRTLRQLRRAFGVSIAVRASSISIEGEESQVTRALTASRSILMKLSAEGFSHEEIDSIIGEQDDHPGQDDPEALPVFPRGRFIAPKTAGQRKFVQSLMENTITFGIGPAGTGKTYLSVAAAVSGLRKGSVRRIVLVRPAVEAGEKLGFLPGDLREKVDPYLRPLYDSMNDMLEADQMTRLMASDVIEVAPLAFMRGRTLNKCFVILDEAQNCSIAQMKMFLTRLGFGSKAAVTGDITQSDLPDSVTSGLLHASRILRDIPGINFCNLGQDDIVRHPLVQRIVDAYGKYEEKNRKSRARSDQRSARENP
ncbi:MAG: PhoH family protein [Candidatus Brocadiia bacterium]